MKINGPVRASAPITFCLALFVMVGLIGQPAITWATEAFVIAASPSLKHVLERIGHGFEQSHPGVRVQLYFDSGLGLRQTIAGMENSMVGRYFIGTGPINLIAPGGDELISRLEQKYYVLPGTKHPYAQERLVLVVPESLVEAPESFEEIARKVTRLAVADPERTSLGKQTQAALAAYGIAADLKGRLDIATDWQGVLDHVLSGQADAGILHGHEAFMQRERLRVTAVAQKGDAPAVHSMAMERYCPNRTLCYEFLDYIQSEQAQRIVRQSGYEAPPTRSRP